jgi:hypothetical protein
MEPRDREAVSAHGGLFEIRIDGSSSVAVHLCAGATYTLVVARLDRAIQ